MLFGLFLKQLFGSAGLPRSVKSQGKKRNVFQGQGKVGEFCIWSGKFGTMLEVGEKSRNLYHFGYYEHQVTRTTKGN